MSLILVGRCWALKIDRKDRLVLMALCDSAEDDGTSCYPKPAYIAWKTDTALASVYRSLERLEAAGVIAVVGMHGGAVEYAIHLEKAAAKLPYQQKRKRGRPRIEQPKPKAARTKKDSQIEKKPSQIEKTFSQFEKVSTAKHGPKAQAASGLTRRPARAIPDVVIPDVMTSPAGARFSPDTQRWERAPGFEPHPDDVKAWAASDEGRAVLGWDRDRFGWPKLVWKYREEMAYQAAYMDNCERAERGELLPAI